MSSEDENAIRVLADIEKSERHLLDLYQEHSHGLVQYQHLYLFGIARRAYTIATFCSEE
jgi:hypothetical protein